MGPIVLMTDFGTEDGYVGIMKGVIEGILPGATVIDLSHDLPAQSILAGALTLQRAVSYFPAGSVFVCVVDPGVGTKRRSIAAKLGDHFYVGPDNGLLTLWLDACEQADDVVEIVHLDQPQYWLPKLSNSFHGRDVYAPTGAHLASGVALTALGTPIVDPVCIEIPVPQPTNRGWIGHILHIDHFGNLATNIERKHLIAFAEDIDTGIKKVRVRYGEYSILGIQATFGNLPEGTLTAIIDSAGRLSLTVVNGSARDYLKAEIGDNVWVITREL
ncbi:MAG: SAM-dependent chlorinase/fluorinase [Anaerolineae bacterium]|nr:SAM-dependent chlorinase/fluorinase [Anaerolineae bacterium]